MIVCVPISMVKILQCAVVVSWMPMNWCGKNIVVCSGSGILDDMIVCVPISMVKILWCAAVVS